MNFAFDPTKVQTPTQPKTTTQSVIGFSFGNIGAGDAGKSLSTLTTIPTQPKPGGFFSSASTGTAAAAFGSGLGIGTNTIQQSSTPTPALTFGANAACTPGLGLGFGMTTSTPVTGLGTTGLRMPGAVNFSTPSTASTFSLTPTSAFSSTNMASTTTGFTLSATTPTTTIMTTTTTTSAPTLSFGPTATATQASTGFCLGGNTVQTSAPVSIPSLTTSTAAGLVLHSGNVAAPTSTPGFSIPVTTSVSAVTPNFTLGGSTATVSSLGSFLQPGTASTAATNITEFKLSKTTTAAPTPTMPTSSTPQTTLGTLTTVSASSSAGQANTINFCQLEETMNKWTLELEEQEKVFMNQAAQVNAWDKLLITNGEKIVTLNQEVERVKLEQQQLEHELDYVVGQQKELQDCLVPLEKELASLTVSDPEREYTYKLAEKLDSQLKRMSEDLKEIIEHLNEANRAQDLSDPIVQIGKILNAHMNSLQWLDQRTTVLAQNIQQIDQMHQNFRQENERSFSLAYN